jgi:CubicO group peptidase (beta-lactamase class C family)
MFTEHKLDAVLKEIIARWNVPGMGVGIVQGSEIVYARGFGVQSLETQVPVTPDSVFCLASIAKCFVACAILQLVEQGRLELDAPLIQYLPYFRLDDDRYRLITLRQILSHTSGMPDMSEDEYDDLVANPESDEGAAERYVRALSGRKMIADPGERFAYSNIAYNVLGDLIAKVSGQTFEAYMKERILQPAGMDSSTFLLSEVDQRRLAVPHVRTPGLNVNPIYPYHRADAPASFLHVSVVDACHWIITSLNRGLYEGRRILTPASYDLMWTPVVKREDPPFREEMGLGWTMGHYEGHRTIGHGGGGFGWTCFLVLLPDQNAGAIVVSNDDSSGHERSLEAVIRALIGEEPRVGTISWMIPVARALQDGGIRSAYACYEEIRNNPDYSIEDYELMTLVYQLMSARKYDLATEVLELNVSVFPNHAGSYFLLAKNHIRKNDFTRAETALQKVLEILPGNQFVTRMLTEVQQKRIEHE